MATYYLQIETGDSLLQETGEELLIDTGTLEYAGTATARPTITITSTADNGETTVEIESLTTGEVFQWTGTLDTDDVLVIDCEARHVTRNGDASMTGQDGDFLQLQPGDNQWEMSGFAGTVTITYRDRYL